MQPLPACYLNGEYLPVEAARISPFDRGFLYADGCYEVMPVYGGRPFRFAAHCERMTRSLGEIRIADPHSRDDWRRILGGLVERNGGGDLYIYWQVTRGTQQGHTHAPLPDIPRTVFAFCAPLPRASAETLARGVDCVTAPDTRWARCDVKSVSLLANVLLRQLAVDAGAGETILLRDGSLTEASASAVHVVVDGELRTPPRSHRTLPGTTADVVAELAARAGIAHRSAEVSEAELRAADEIWLSAATREVQPVCMLDGRPVGPVAPDGHRRPGPVWQAMYAQFQTLKRELQGQPW